MRLLHTADWHLGRALCGQSFHAEQERLLTGAFLDILRETKPDAVLLAGDIYDRALPPADSVELLDEVLQRIVRGLGIPVVMIAGNHDDERRLAFGSRLLRDAGLHICDSAMGCAFPFEDAHGPVSILAAGYGTPALLAQLFGAEAGITTHDAGFAAVTAHLRGLAPRSARSVVVAHAFVSGGLTSESERMLQVGGSGAVSAAHLAGFHYTALGHLHRRQSMAEGRIAYSGSPLAYSFSEAGSAKSVTLVELDATGHVTAEEIALTPRHPLRVIRGTLADVLAAADGPGREDWLQVILTDRQLGAKALLQERYPSVLELRFESPLTTGEAGGTTGARMPQDPLEALMAFRAAIGAGQLAEEERAAAIQAIQAALAGER
ncbi:exonuclease SbcCD subunit D [Sediminicoccus sp. BL-A-41-H5]|uniref:exonuclease SbcCD subunit D n=1 Tax=Sediminicoccus sp. BL-A-41-H5 TaxID=3421106 RepID=UPI003D66ED69